MDDRHVSRRARLVRWSALSWVLLGAASMTACEAEDVPVGETIPDASSEGSAADARGDVPLSEVSVTGDAGPRPDSEAIDASADLGSTVDGGHVEAASDGSGDGGGDDARDAYAAATDATFDGSHALGDGVLDLGDGSDLGDALDGAGSATDAQPGDIADGAFACDGPGSRYVTDVVSYMFGTGQNFGQDTFPANIIGPPKGGGSTIGSTDVVSLGNGGSVTVAFAGNEIVDGPGPDFIVFENAFDIGGDPTNPFAELGIVEVSQDGVQWYAYACTATQYPYGTCAGWHPVFANPDTNSIDPTDPVTAGGDPFDLADLGLAWARYVRVTDRPDDNNVFDLDAVAIVHPRCP